MSNPNPVAQYSLKKYMNKEDGTPENNPFEIITVTEYEETDEGGNVVRRAVTEIRSGKDLMNKEDDK